MILNDTNNNKKKAIAAFRELDGNVSKVCKALGIYRSTFYDWCDNDEDFRKQIEEIKDEQVDFYEQQLKELAKGARYDALDADGNIVRLQDKPNPTAVIFALKTKGKSRGYVEKTEIDMNVQPVQITIDKGDI
jgi:hypothetical protein